MLAYVSIYQGIVNTFTEHHGGAWSVKDMQHTYVNPLVLSRRPFSCGASLLGVVWWVGGALGVYLSRNNQVWLSRLFQPLSTEQILEKRHPGFDVRGRSVSLFQSHNIVRHDSIILTGWAMSDHAQALMLSTKVSLF